MPDWDVLVIGAGPAGHAAALTAAANGARVAVVEADKPGGQCVHYSCIPTAAMLSAAGLYVDAQELAVMGVLGVGDRLSWDRMVARKDALVHRLSTGAATSLRMAGVEVLAGSADLGDRVTVTGAEGAVTETSAARYVVATGSRWEASVPGVPAGRVLSGDSIHALPSPPASALVIDMGPAGTAFAVEYAFLLATAGTSVTYAPAATGVVPGLDEELQPLAASVLTDLGVKLADPGPPSAFDSFEAIVVPDPRRPAGGEALQVDREGRTRAPNVWAAGDVTGGLMTTAAAMHMGHVAGANATGETRQTQLRHLPSLLHTEPGIGWVGLTEAGARAAGRQVAVGLVDLGWTARAVTLGGRDGALKLVGDAEVREILGVHMVGPDVPEVMAAAAVAMQAELTVDDLAAIVHWHPSAGEALSQAARAAARHMDT